MDTWPEVKDAAAAGDIAAAVAAARRLLKRDGGVPPAAADEDFRAFNRALTIWEQIDFYAEEVDRWPRHGRLWKLLGYAYMRAGIYVPALLRAAEQSFLISAAHTDDDALSDNLEEKVALCQRAAAGDEEARAEVAASEGLFARETEEIPASVPVPALFIQMGIADRPALIITVESLAPGLREAFEDRGQEWTEN